MKDFKVRDSRIKIMKKKLVEKSGIPLKIVIFIIE